MAKEIILYNLAEHVTDEEFKDYVAREKGPLMDSLPSVDKYELVKITDSDTGAIPFKYVGIMHLNNLDEFRRKDMLSPQFQAFQKKFRPMVSEAHLLFGEEIY